MNKNYCIKVNCGGDEIDGFSADKLYIKGSWGYINEGMYWSSFKSIVSKSEINNVEGYYLNGNNELRTKALENDFNIPNILKTARYSNGSPLRYLFDVPDGTYMISLYFTEPFLEGKARRLFDIIINGSILISNLDIFEIAGAVHCGILKEICNISPINGQIEIIFKGKREAAFAFGIIVEQISSVMPLKSSTSLQLKPSFIPFNDTRIVCYGNWRVSDNAIVSDTPGSAIDMIFSGKWIRFAGKKNINHGIAEIYIDGNLEIMLDTYSKKEQKHVVLFERNDLEEMPYHHIRIMISREKNLSSKGCIQAIQSFECDKAVDTIREVDPGCFEEIRYIESGYNTISKPSQWTAVKKIASAPLKNVSLNGGKMGTAFDRNVNYLIKYWDAIWFEWWPASAEARRMLGAACALVWKDNLELRNRLKKLFTEIKDRQRSDGYVLPFDELYLSKRVYGKEAEKSAYDRRLFTIGLVHLGKIDPNAYEVARKFQDWLYKSPYMNSLLDRSLGIAAIDANMYLYFSPKGSVDDAVMFENYLRLNWWIESLSNRVLFSFSRYPIDRPHCYLLTPLIAFTDAYMATGDKKYLEAILGAWDLIKDNYLHVGGSIAICEDRYDGYPYKSYYLTKHTGENCGGVMWINFNHRLLQLYPDEEKYANEIEKTLYNVTLANQDIEGKIRYHTNLEGKKDTATSNCTCCEVHNTWLLSRLPELIYSISNDGLYINLFEPSTIEWKHMGADVRATICSSFPFDPIITIILGADTPIKMKMHLRIPSWVMGNVEIKINGRFEGHGKPGSYDVIDRIWFDGDKVEVMLEFSFRLTKYIGFDRDPIYDKYALEYGPLLMALKGGTEVYIEGDFIQGLNKLQDGDLSFQIEGNPGKIYVPYLLINDEEFTVYPRVITN